MKSAQTSEAIKTFLHHQHHLFKTLYRSLYINLFYKIWKN